MRVEGGELRHEFRTLCSLVADTLITSEHLREGFPGDQLPRDEAIRIQAIESSLRKLCSELNDRADDYRQDNLLVDLELPARIYDRCQAEWRSHLTQFLTISDQLMLVNPVAVTQDLRKPLSLLQRIQQQQTVTPRERCASRPNTDKALRSSS